MARHVLEAAYINSYIVKVKAIEILTVLLENTQMIRCLLCHRSGNCSVKGVHGRFLYDETEAEPLIAIIWP